MLKIPTIHLNGSNGETLFEEVSSAHEAIRTALEKLEAGAPNARDYYVQGNKEFEQARNQHCMRSNKLRDVMKELDEIRVGIREQLDERRHRSRK